MSGQKRATATIRFVTTTNRAYPTYSIVCSMSEPSTVLSI